MPREGGTSLADRYLLVRSRLADHLGNCLKCRPQRRRLAPDQRKMAASARIVEPMNRNARIARFLAQRDLGQEGDALSIGDEFDNGRKRGGSKGAARPLAFKPTSGDRLIAKTMPLIEQQNPLRR